MTETTERQSNRAPWLALLLVLVALALNVGIFLGMPGQWAVPWLSLLAGIAAALFGVLGIWRAFGRSYRYGGKISSCILGILALAFGGLMVLGWFTGHRLPASSGAPRVGQKAPDFTLNDTRGNKVSLGQLLRPEQSAGAPGTSEAGGSTLGGGSTGAGNAAAPKAVLLIFYRGYW